MSRLLIGACGSEFSNYGYMMLCLPSITLVGLIQTASGDSLNTESLMAAKKHWSAPLKSQWINSVAISDDGSKLIAGTYFYNTDPANPATKTVGVFGYDPSKAELWPALEFDATALAGKWAGIYSVAISRDGKYAAAGGSPAGGTGVVYVYKVNSPTGNQFQIATPTQKVTCVAIAGKTTTGDYILAAGAEALYISIGSGTTWSTNPIVTNTGVEELSISADGRWIIAALDGGFIMLVENTNSTAAGLTTYGPFQLTSGYVQAVAMAADGSGFAAATTIKGVSGAVYYFDTTAFAVNPIPATPWSWTAPLAGCVSCRSVAVSKDGTYISAVGTVGTVPATATGTLFLLKNLGSTFNQEFASASGVIAQSPNSTCMDGAGLNIAVADGYKAHDANAAFYLFSPATPGDPTSETLQWTSVTKAENRPVQISGNGNAIVGGSDNGHLYYFSVP
jgi:WD40 repeat protein